MQHPIHRRLEILRAVEPETGLDDILRDAAGMYGRRIRLLGDVDAVAPVVLLIVKRDGKHMEPERHVLRVQIGVEGLLLHSRTETDLLEFRIVRHIGLIQRARYELPPLHLYSRHDLIDRMLDDVDIFLIAGNDTDLSALSVCGLLYRKHARDHLIAVHQFLKIHAASPFHSRGLYGSRGCPSVDLRPTRFKLYILYL